MNDRRGIAVLMGAVMIVAAAVLGAGAQGAQSATAAAPALQVSGDVGKALSLTPSQLKLMTRARVETKSEDGTPHIYDGVAVADILTAAEATIGGPMGRNTIGGYLVAQASDGYQALFALAEVDRGFASNDIIVADTIDSQALPAATGPWRLIVSKDLRSARSVRMLQRLEVVHLKK